MRRIVDLCIGVLCVAYSVMASFIGNFNLGVVLPGAVGMCFILCACFHKQWKVFTNTRPGKIVRAGVVFVLLTFVISVVGMFAASKNTPESDRDAVIVLGAGLRGDRLSRTLLMRLDKALEYAADNARAVIVVSGGQGPGETVTEASAMRAYLTLSGVDEGRIIAEDKSTSTEENFMFSKDMLDNYFAGEDYAVVYVTNDFHVMRAGLYAKKAGLQAEGLACESPPYLLPAFYTREYLALMWSLANEATAPFIGVIFAVARVVICRYSGW